MRERLRESHLDIAALIWMFCIAGITAVEIYGAFDSRFDGFGDDDGWITAALLASTGNFVLSFGCMVGIGLAAWADSVASRIALVVAVIGGAWAIVASLVGVAAIYHESEMGSLNFTSFGENRVVNSFGTLMQGGLGIVVVLVAASLLASRRVAREDEFEIADLD